MDKLHIRHSRSSPSHRRQTQQITVLGVHMLSGLGERTLAVGKGRRKPYHTYSYLGGTLANNQKVRESQFQSWKKLRKHRVHPSLTMKLLTI